MSQFGRQQIRERRRFERVHATRFRFVQVLAGPGFCRVLTSLCLVTTVFLHVSSSPVVAAPVYPDARPTAVLRLEAMDQGRLLRHGEGPANCDRYGMREAIVFEDGDTYYLHYDGSGLDGWRACLATSRDLKHWELHGPILELGSEGSQDFAGACSPWVFREADSWHMFYLGTPNASPPPERVPAFPYLTLKARSGSPSGPWEKQYAVTPFSTRPQTYYSATASPGHVVKNGREYLMFFSASTPYPDVKRTLGIARTRDLNGAWRINAKPIVPLEEQIENSSLYYEPKNRTWFLFTNHIGLNDQGQEYTDAIWVYWSRNLKKWDTRNKAVVVDGYNCSWSDECIGMPSVIQVGNRLAIFYDAPGGTSLGHVNRDIGLAWLDLPLDTPSSDVP
jgi:predicted GH43/DUF377 family glycosyl hydrolase